MKTTKLSIYLYIAPFIDDTNLYKLMETDQLTNNLDYTAKLTIDFNTIAMGPELNDFILTSKSDQVIGRLVFQLTCTHLSNIEISIKSVTCTFNKIIQNNITLNSKFYCLQRLYEDNYTLPLSHVVEKKSTIYKWENNNEDDNDMFFNYKLLLSAKDFMSSNLNIFIYDTVFNLKENTLRNYKRSEVLPNPILKTEECNYTDPKSNILRRTSEFIPDLFNGKKGLRHTVTTPNLFQMQFTHNHIGTMNIDFYENFDGYLTKYIQTQSGKFFEKYSFLYFSDKSQNNDFNMKIIKDLEKNFVGEVFDNDGEVIGEVNGVISIKKFPLFIQLQYSKHTERGFELIGNSPHLRHIRLQSDDGNDKELSQEIKNLQNIYNKFMDVLSDTNNGETYNISEKHDLLVTLDVYITNLKLYCHYYDIFQSQDIMIKIGLLLVENIDNFHKNNRYIVFNLLEVLLLREEFNLNTMSICVNETDDEKRNLNLKIGIAFLELVYRLLIYALNNFVKEFIDSKTKVFISKALAICYIIIPEFRNKFLHELKSLDFEEDPWIDKDESMFSKDISFLALTNYQSIDWKNLFYDRLFTKSDRFGKKTKKIVEELETLLAKKIWRDKVAKKDRLCFSMIKYLHYYSKMENVKKMEELNTNNGLVHTEFPGYQDILRLINERLTTLEIGQYPPELIEILKQFSNNSVYDIKSVKLTIKILDTLFQNNQNLIFKYNFDYHILQRAMSIVLDNDHSLGVCSVLWFYYRNVRNMSTDHFVDFIKNEIEKKFFHFFFHWCYQVRDLFYYLLLFAIMHYLDIKIKHYQGEITNSNGDSSKKSSNDIERVNSISPPKKLSTVRSLHSDKLTNKAEMYAVILKQLLNKFDEDLTIITEIKDETSFIGDNEYYCSKKLEKFHFKNRLLPKYVKGIQMTNIIWYIKQIIFYSGIKHFLKIEKVFKTWDEMRLKNSPSQSVEFPKIELIHLKDDYVEDLIIDY